MEANPNKNAAGPAPEGYQPQTPAIINVAAELSEENNTQENEPMSKFKFEIVKHKGYRFIGCAVYCNHTWGHDSHPIVEILGSVWNATDWVMKTLDAMTEYHTDMPYGAALYTMDKYDPNKPSHNLQGYIIGKFMKVDTPVPDGMDWYDIPEGYVAKGYGGYVEDEVHDAIRKTDGYNSAQWMWHGEVFDNLDSMYFGPPERVAGYFVPCTKKETAEELMERLNNISSDTDPKTASDACNDIGLKLRQRGKFDEALTAFEKAIGILPKQSDEHYTRRGGVYHRMENHEKAIEFYSKALEMGKNRWARLERGMSYFALGETAKAVADYHALRTQIEAEEGNPDNWGHQEKLRELVADFL